MSPAPLVVAFAAGLAGTAVLAIPAVRPAPAAAVTSQTVALGAAAHVRMGVQAATVVPSAPLVPAGARVPVVPPAVVVRPRAPAAPFRWPLSPAPDVMRRFAVGPHPWSPGHRGVDLGGAAGQHVLAAGAGIVTFAGVLAGRGVVAVAHPGGLRTTYEPVTAGVRVGEAVAVGDALGSLATGGHCPTACLHWGALRGDVYIDPLSLLRPPAPPVLLPLGSGR
jgi:murein DD-endopeptidase MepM/ murein hydrolase activator NlpD